MNIQTYVATGQVIDRETTQGMPDLQVEAWDSNTRKPQQLGATKTDENGRFRISFDLKKFGYETPPDLFFKVYGEQRLLQSTESSVFWNANSQENVTIKINTRPPREDGKDLVSLDHMMMAVDFVQLSDFKGVIGEYGNRAFASFGLLSDIFKNPMNKLDFSPVRVKGPRVTDVVDQNVDTATTNLKAKNITVTEVVPYKPGIRDSMSAIANIRSLKAGQEVKLYEENGTVRYYSVVKKAAPIDDDAVKSLQEETVQLKRNNEELKNAHATLVRQNDEASKKLETQEGDMVKLREELKENQKIAAVKEEEIKSLKRELEGMKKDHSEITSIFRSENFVKLLKDIGEKPDVKGTKKTPGKGGKNN